MFARLKRQISKIPIFGSVISRVYRFVFAKPRIIFSSSGQYWEDRYQAGMTSGSGSYGRLAEFKANYLNDLVVRNSISTVVEFGCGDGAQLALARYPHYTGFDVSDTSVKLCRERFSSIPTYQFHSTRSAEFAEFGTCDLALSLDVIYHLIEDEVYDSYMRKLFASSHRFVAIYAYDFDRTYAAKHEKGRHFTAWIAQNAPGWTLTEKQNNPYPYDPADADNTSQSDFFCYART